MAEKKPGNFREKMRLYRRLLSYLRYYRLRTIFIILALFGESIASVFGIAMLKPILDLIFSEQVVANYTVEATPLEYRGDQFEEDGLYIIRVVGTLDSADEADFARNAENWLGLGKVSAVVVDLRGVGIETRGWGILSDLCIGAQGAEGELYLLTDLPPPTEIESVALRAALREPANMERVDSLIDSMVAPVIEEEEVVNSLRQRFKEIIAPAVEAFQDYAIDNPYQVIIWLAALMLFMAVIRGVFGFYSVYTTGFICDGIIRRIQVEIFEKMVSFEEGFYSKANVGHLISYINNDANEVRPALETIFLGVIKGPINLIVVLVAMLIISPQMTLWMAFILPVLLVPTIVVGRIIMRYSRRVQHRKSGLTIVLHEALTGMRIVRAYGTEKREVKRFAKENWEVFRYKVKAVMVQALSTQITFVVSTIAVCIVLLINGYFILRDNTFSGSDFVVFLFLMTAAYRPMRGMARSHRNIIQALAGAERFFPVLDRESLVKEKPDAIELPPFKDEVVFDNVSFSYGDENVLSEIKLRVPAGRVVAIVGSSGSGKTSMVNLVPRFYDPTEGSVMIDGHDLRNVTNRSLREQIALVTQDSILFDDSVRHNIAYGADEVDEERLVAAARAANAHNFIMEMPEGYDTVVGDRGVRLSGGQRQRLSIARALYKRAPILILDEATSALDTESEREVQAAIDHLIKGHTAFVIAHRLSTIAHADEIIVLREGRIIERGRHDELLALNGEYAKFYRLQSTISESHHG